MARRRLPYQQVAGLQAHPTGSLHVLLAEQGEGSEALAHAAARARRGAQAIRIPATARAAPPGGLEGEREAGLPPLQARRAERADQEAEEARQPPARRAEPTHQAGRALEHGFRAGQPDRRRRFRVLTVVDVFTRECLAVHADSSLSGHKVGDVLDGIALERGYPEQITVDNGTEFYSRAMDAWAYRHRVKLDFIRPGKPMENGYIESFNGRLPLARDRPAFGGRSDTVSAFRSVSTKPGQAHDLSRPSKVRCRSAGAAACVREGRQVWHGGRHSMRTRGRPPIVPLTPSIQCGSRGTSVFGSRALGGPCAIRVGLTQARRSCAIACLCGLARLARWASSHRTLDSACPANARLRLAE